MAEIEVSGEVIYGGGPTLELRVEAVETPATRTGDEALAIVAAPVRMSELIELWTASPWLAGVGKLIRDAIGGARLTLEATVDSPDEAQRERALEWLMRPSIAVDGQSELDVHEFLAAAFLHEDQTGNVFVEILRAKNGLPGGFALIPPQFVWFEFDRGRRAWQLHMRTPYGDEAVFVPFGKRESGEERHEYLHRRRPNLVSSIWGLPDWIEARESVEVDIEHRRYLLRFFQHDTSPRRIIWATQDPAWAQSGTLPSLEQVREVRRFIASFMAANRGQASGRTLVLTVPGGVLIQELPLAAKTDDPTFEKAAKAARDEILAVRRVSMIDLGLPEGGYRATAETQSRSFRDQVLKPAARGVLRLINRVLRAPEPVGLGITDWRAELEFERVEEVLAKVEALVKAAGVPVLTPDEARQLLGYAPAGDDQLWRPATMVSYAEQEEPAALDEE